MFGKLFGGNKNEEVPADGMEKPVGEGYKASEEEEAETGASEGTYEAGTYGGEDGGYCAESCPYGGEQERPSGEGEEGEYGRPSGMGESSEYPSEAPSYNASSGYEGVASGEAGEERPTEYGHDAEGEGAGEYGLPPSTGDGDFERPSYGEAAEEEEEKQEEDDNSGQGFSGYGGDGSNEYEQQGGFSSHGADEEAEGEAEASGYGGATYGSTGEYGAEQDRPEGEDGGYEGPQSTNYGGYEGGSGGYEQSGGYQESAEEGSERPPAYGEGAGYGEKAEEADTEYGRPEGDNEGGETAQYGSAPAYGEESERPGYGEGNAYGGSDAYGEGNAYGKGEGTGGVYGGQEYNSETQYSGEGGEGY